MDEDIRGILIDLQSFAVNRLLPALVVIAVVMLIRVWRGGRTKEQPVSFRMASPADAGRDRENYMPPEQSAPQPPSYQPPPPYMPQQPNGPPNRNRNTVLLILAGCGCVGIAGVVVLAAILFPVFAAARNQAVDASCLSNMKQQGLATLMYSQDNDERLPPKGPWMDLTLPYFTNETLFHCPAVVRVRDYPFNYGYAFDARLARISLEKIATPEATPMIFESTILSRNAWDKGETFAIFPPRHSSPSSGQGGHVVLADGHVKLMGSYPAPSN